MSRDAVLELFAENLPPAWVQGAAARLKRRAADELSRQGAACGSLEVWATSRRLVLYAESLSSSAAAKALAQFFSAAAAGLGSAQDMSWDPSGFRFPRPVRGLLGLYGDKVLRFSLAGLESGRVTFGHEAAGARRLTVASAERYLKALEHASVIVRDDSRLAAMRGHLAAAGRRMKLNVEGAEETLRRNLYLSEYPVCVVSGFSQKFLELPREALDAAFARLALFPVSDGTGRRQPYFAGFRDGVSKGQRSVEEGFRQALEELLAAAALQNRPARQHRP